FREITLTQLKDHRRSTWDMEREYISGLLAHFTAHRHFFDTALSERSALSDTIRHGMQKALNNVLDELVAVAVTECATHRPDVPLATVGIKMRIAIAMVIGIVTSQHWLLPRADQAWSTDQLVDNLTAFTLYGVQNGPDSTARQGR